MVKRAPQILTDDALLELIRNQRRRRRVWWRLATDLNGAKIRAVGGPWPWTAGNLRQWADRRTYRKTSIARRRASRAHFLRGRVVDLYLANRANRDRCKRVVDELRAAGVTRTPHGGTITTKWVSGVAAAAGVRVPAGPMGRPRRRGECFELMPWCCPLMSCRHHIGPDVLDAAERTYRREDLRPIPRSWAARILAGDFSMMPATCSLDYAEGLVDGDPACSSAEVGRRLGISREWVRQILRSGLGSLSERDAEVVAYLQRAYAQSKLGGPPGGMTL